MSFPTAKHVERGSTSPFQENLPAERAQAPCGRSSGPEQVEKESTESGSLQHDAGHQPHARNTGQHGRRPELRGPSAQCFHTHTHIDSPTWPERVTHAQDPHMPRLPEFPGRPLRGGAVVAVLGVERTAAKSLLSKQQLLELKLPLGLLLLYN